MNSPTFLTHRVKEQTWTILRRSRCAFYGARHAPLRDEWITPGAEYIAGAKLPKSLLGAGVGNSLGHWESVALMNYNDELLKQLDSDWRDWRALSIERLPLKRRRDIKAEIGDLLAAEYEQAPLTVVKDPRICRFAPLFLQALDEAGITPHIVHALRNPLEIGRLAGAAGRDTWRRGGSALAPACPGWRGSVARTQPHHRQLLGPAERLARHVRSHRTGVARRVAIFDRRDWQQIAQSLDPESRHHEHTTEDVLLTPEIRDWVGEATRRCSCSSKMRHQNRQWRRSIPSAKSSTTPRRSFTGY